MMRLRTLMAMVILVLVAGCATTPHPVPKAAQPAGVRESGEPPIDVYLLPVGNFPYPFTVALARKLSADLHLNVRASLPMGIGELRDLPNSTQLSGSQIVERAHDVGLRLPTRNSKLAVIALTTRDINLWPRTLRFLFAVEDNKDRTEVISVARMGYSTRYVKATPAQVALRIYKMTKRAIGEEYFGLPRSSDISDIMYAPIMSLEDIDAMGISYKGLNR